MSRVVTKVGSALDERRESSLWTMMVGDVAEILTSLCARLQGRRGTASRARRAVDAVTDPEAPG
ncbi:hypothetical protein [Micromonospora sp. NPDC005205]|uniref:hypothetical protein n=1 Tax=Micromonospora sp. NPDC005205 TaxID=3156714 RepID=UPI0033A6856F